MIVPSAEQIKARLEKIQPVDDFAVKSRYDHGGGRMYREEGKSRSLPRTAHGALGADAGDLEDAGATRGHSVGVCRRV